MWSTPRTMRAVDDRMSHSSLSELRRYPDDRVPRGVPVVIAVCPAWSTRPADRRVCRLRITQSALDERPLPAARREAIVTPCADTDGLSGHLRMSSSCGPGAVERVR